MRCVNASQPIWDDMKVRKLGALELISTKICRQERQPRGISMRGGILRLIQASCACQRLLGRGILCGLTVLLASPGYAHEGFGDEHCQKKEPAEQSIMVSVDKAEETGSRVAIITDREEELEPIANVSDAVPDLAEPIIPVPELAESVEETTQKVVKDDSSEVVEEDSDVISFEGVTPGISHRRDVFQAWGDPVSDGASDGKLQFRFERFKSVEASFDGDVVDAITVQLIDALPLKSLIERLGLTCRPAVSTDDEGEAVAQVYPERGVVLSLIQSEKLTSDDEEESSTLLVNRIVIQPIKAEPFILRAESTFIENPSQSIADLETALQLDNTSAHANWLLAELEMTRGKAVASERYASLATELDSKNLAFRLQWAKTLRLLAQYDQAVDEARVVLQTPGLDPLLRAEALYEMGMLAALGNMEVAKSAIPLHQKSIEIADKLTSSENGQLARAARKLLVEAHLAIALEIARGDWDEKEDTVPQWIERASALAEGLIAEDEGMLKLRLQVAVNALAAAASLDKPIDPLLWIEEAEQTAKLLRKSSKDPISRGQIDWSLGLAYFQAAQIEHRRSEPDAALRLGKLADAKLGDLAKDRDQLPDTSYLMGRLYFQIGAVHAVHFEDHVEACNWYEQATERLLNPVPVTTMATPQQHGDALVSMGVSFWQAGNREQALKITESGVNLIEQAVKCGLLDSDSLVIPYGNLAAMFEAQGKIEPAEKYTELAQKLNDTEQK